MMCLISREKDTQLIHNYHISRQNRLWQNFRNILKHLKDLMLWEIYENWMTLAVKFVRFQETETWFVQQNWYIHTIIYIFINNYPLKFTILLYTKQNVGNVCWEYMAEFTYNLCCNSNPTSTLKETHYIFCPNLIQMLLTPKWRSEAYCLVAIARASYWGGLLLTRFNFNSSMDK